MRLVRRRARVVLETERLRLREMLLADLSFVASMLGHSEVMRYWPRCYTRDEAEAWVRRQRERYRRDGYGYWLVLERISGVPVGQAGLLLCDVEGRSQVALGYIIHQPFWGRGYGAESAAACLAYGFREAGQQRIVALVRPENVRSRRVAEAIGMASEGSAMYEGFRHLVYAASQSRAQPDKGAR